MDYRAFDVQDFLADEDFISWVTQPTPENESFWKNWLSHNPDRRELVESARYLLENIDFTETWEDHERFDMWKYIQANMHSHATVIPLHKGRGRWWKLPYAAAITLLILAAGWFYLGTRPIEIRTAYGKQEHITLDDGTKIFLNANSELSFSRNFTNGAVREVWIQGEAFFDVAKMIKDGRRVPFTVHTDQLDIRVLGTAFNITNRRGRVDVALEHGSVKLVDVKDATKTLLLKPGERATQLAGTAPIQKEVVDVNEYSSWKDKVVHYRSKTLKELAQMINDSYGVEIVIENKSLMDEKFTGSFPSDSVEIFFEKLGKLYPLEITKKGNIYHLN